jgi:cellulose biosynthesis protein BcsQ
LPTLTGIFQQQTDGLRHLGPVIVNRDLNGRVRLIVHQEREHDESARAYLKALTREMAERLGTHAYPPEKSVLFEEDLDAVLAGVPSFPLEGVEGVSVVDRLATEGNWATISPPAQGAPRIVFFSIKGGVGRSTALSVAAWSLAEQGRRVLVLDLDLESPGLSSSLLPDDRRPTFGIADWLVEDLVDNGVAVFEDMVATSLLSHDGEIFVVPAYGRDPGEYVAKLGRAWMPKFNVNGTRDSWSRRLDRLISALEARWRPDVVLIDSRSGIDEVASACVTDLGAHAVLLFALEGEQTWSGYRILLRHWRTMGVVRDIRERLQLVGAMIPEVDSAAYFGALREHAWNVFSEELYDEVPPGEVATEPMYWSFDETDEGAPHHPWGVRWNRGFAALSTLHDSLTTLDVGLLRALFGPLVDGVFALVDPVGVR